MLRSTLFLEGLLNRRRFDLFTRVLEMAVDVPDYQEQHDDDNGNVEGPHGFADLTPVFAKNETGPGQDAQRQAQPPDGKVFEGIQVRSPRPLQVPGQVGLTVPCRVLHDYGIGQRKADVVGAAASVLGGPRSPSSRSRTPD